MFGRLKRLILTNVQQSKSYSFLQLPMSERGSQPGQWIIASADEYLLDSPPEKHFRESV
jgi:hypothetical protein